MNGPRLCCAACGEITDSPKPLCESCRTQLEVHAGIGVAEDIECESGRESEIDRERRPLSRGAVNTGFNSGFQPE